MVRVNPDVREEIIEDGARCVDHSGGELACSGSETVLNENLQELSISASNHNVKRYCCYTSYCYFYNNFFTRGISLPIPQVEEVTNGILAFEGLGLVARYWGYLGAILG